MYRSGYRARRAEELPVLTRWMPADAVTAPVAKFLDLILYSCEQCAAENQAMGKAPSDGMNGLGCI